MQTAAASWGPQPVPPAPAVPHLPSARLSLQSPLLHLTTHPLCRFVLLSDATVPLYDPLTFYQQVRAAACGHTWAARLAARIDSTRVRGGSGGTQPCRPDPAFWAAALHGCCWRDRSAH